MTTRRAATGPGRLPTRLSAPAIRYIACEAFRRYGPLEPDVPAKLRRNVRRNFRVGATLERVHELAAHYKAMYEYAASRIPAYIRPVTGKYADPEDVRIPEFRAHLAARYPREPRRVLDLLTWYTVHYEHLR